ncbi:membrane cofactor protein-like isoform X8 [Mastacembelus armatus]|uniref:membrane cofactor protein-like isoform X8 n=1 Tax=Mastacembelus armatus TaxID=205130 RepID=UPI000E460539|nr:membrane cofactor protein-like isoform X8 [Mastacembelus armatus]
MGVTSFLLLSSLGLAMVQAQNCPKPVPGNNMNLRGNDILKDTFENGAKVNFACSSGFTPGGGSPSITCTNGIWSPVTLICQKKTCGSAGEVTNGNIEYVPDNEFGGKAVVKCNTGFISVGGIEMNCEDQGWTGRLPVCEVQTCLPPSQIENGGYQPEREIYRYLENIVYSCRTPDYTLVGENSRTCSSDGTFKPDPPTCAKIECKEPVVENGEWISGARPPYRPKSTVVLQCTSGYTMKGQATQTCDIRGEWSPGLPKCEIECKEPVVENGQRESGAQPPYRPKSTVVLQCTSGYTMKGQATQTCDIRGEWSPGLPKCESTGNQLSTIVGAVVAIILIIAICIGCGWYFGFWKKKQTGEPGGCVDPKLLKVKPSDSED